MLKILVFIDWYKPAYKAGGPISSVYNLTELLGDEIQFYIVKIIMLMTMEATQTQDPNLHLLRL